MLQFLFTPDHDGPGWGFDNKQQKDGNFGKRGAQKRRGGGDTGGLAAAWMRSIKFDQKMLAPGWWLMTEIFTFGAADWTSRDYYFLSNVEIAMWYLWAIVYFPLEWIVDAAVFVVASPAYLIGWLIEVFDDDKDGKRRRRRSGGRGDDSD